MKVKELVNLLLEYTQEADLIFESEMDGGSPEFKGLAEIDDEVWFVLE